CPGVNRCARRAHGGKANSPPAKKRTIRDRKPSLPEPAELATQQPTLCFIRRDRIAMPQLVLIRHGQSAWNLENRFTGWWDVNITDKGVEEARAAGRELKARGYAFDIAYTSLLTRANKTLNLVLEEMDELWLPVVKDWRLNERHYGALTGLNKAEMVAKVGEEQVFIWRRSYDIPPPELEETSEFDVSKDRRYTGLPVPRTESLKDTVARVLPLWDERIAPDLKAGKRVI